ncbi:MAG: hypothetical protein ABIA21_04115 [Candidatus Aenigmatarchaeota archaeon]
MENLPEKEAYRNARRRAQERSSGQESVTYRFPGKRGIVIAIDSRRATRPAGTIGGVLAAVYTSSNKFLEENPDARRIEV